MRCCMELQRDAFIDPTQQAEAQRERIADLVQRPVLIVRFQRQRRELLDLRLSGGVTDRLIDPRRTNFHVCERLGRERFPFAFRHRENAVRNHRIQRFKPRKLACLDSIQAQERELQRLGQCEPQKCLTARKMSQERCRWAAYIPALKDGALRRFR
jgi:hypothetical protein